MRCDIFHATIMLDGSKMTLQGAGMGVTPFLSVLKQLMSEYNKSLCDCCKTVCFPFQLPNFFMNSVLKIL